MTLALLILIFLLPRGILEQDYALEGQPVQGMMVPACFATHFIILEIHTSLVFLIFNKVCDLVLFFASFGLKFQ